MNHDVHFLRPPLAHDSAAVLLLANRTGAKTAQFGGIFASLALTSEEPLVPQLWPPSQRALNEQISRIIRAKINYLHGREVADVDFLALGDVRLGLQGQVLVREDHGLAIGGARVGGVGKSGVNCLKVEVKMDAIFSQSHLSISICAGEGIGPKYSHRFVHFFIAEFLP